MAELDALIALMPNAQQRARVRNVLHGYSLRKLREMTEMEIAMIRFIGPKTAKSVVEALGCLSTPC